MAEVDSIPRVVKYKTKSCDLCGVAFEPSSGRQKRCSKECGRIVESKSGWEREKLRGEEFLERKRAYKRRWKEFNAERVRENSAEYRRKNAEKIKLALKEYAAKNKERIRKNHKAWRDKNRDKLKGYVAKVAPEIKIERDRSYRSMRHKSDPTYRMSRTLRSRVKSAFLIGSQAKQGKTFDLVGMSGAELMDYLMSHPNCEPHFKPENFGHAWVIDHIRPISSFDLSDHNQQKQAFHYSNCQPMSPEKNRVKGNLWQGKWWRNGVAFDLPSVCG
jgi:hypothetical protein